MAKPAIKTNPDQIYLDFTNRFLLWHLCLIEDHLLDFSREPSEQCASCLYWHLEKVIAYETLELQKFEPSCAINQKACGKLTSWAQKVQSKMDKLTKEEAIKLAKEARELRYGIAEMSDVGMDSHLEEIAKLFEKCPKSVLNMVRKTDYYRGTKPDGGEGRRKAIYFTKYLEEAQFYASDGVIIKARISPKRAFCSKTNVDAAEALGVGKEYDRLAGSNTLIEADNLVTDVALAQGYDAMVRRDGDWVVVLKPEIIKNVTTLSDIAELFSKEESAELSIPAPFGWVGGKRQLSKKIVSLIPPHKTYVEPFCGAASVFWAKEPSEVEVLNDLDPDLMRFYRDIGSIEKCNISQISKDWNGLKAREGKLEACEFLSEVLCSFSTTRSSYAPSRPSCPANAPQFHQYLPKYQARLKDTKLHNEDWQRIVQQYDNPTTFFYLDPPYHNTSRQYRYSDDQLTRLVETLPKIKGKWLLSYDDDPDVRQAFVDYHILPTSAVYHIGLVEAGGKKDRGKQLLIANYPIAGKLEDIYNKEGVLADLTKLFEKEGEMGEHLTEKQERTITDLRENYKAIVYRVGESAHIVFGSATERVWVDLDVNGQILGAWLAPASKLSDTSDQAVVSEITKLFEQDAELGRTYTTYAQDMMKKYGVPFDPTRLKSAKGFRFKDRVEMVAYDPSGIPVGAKGTVWAIAGFKGHSICPDPLCKMLFVKWDDYDYQSVWITRVKKIGKLSDSDAELSEPEVDALLELASPEKCKLVRDFYHCRLKSKTYFDPRSFRTVTPREGVRITIGCPKGQWSPSQNRCKVGTEAQRIMYRKDLKQPKLSEAEQKEFDEVERALRPDKVEVVS